MRRVDFVYTVVAVMLILVPSLTLAGEKELRLYTLHPIVGDVIDAGENEKYNIFGPIEGFIAAKYYELVDKDIPRPTYFLHVIGSKDEGGYLIVRELGIRDMQKLHKLEDHLRDFEEMPAGTVPRSQSAPLIPLSKDALKSVGHVLSIKLIDDTEVVGEIVQATVDAVFLKGLQIPVPDSLIKDVQVVPDLPVSSFFGEKRSMKLMTYSVSGISDSAKARFGGTKHLRLWFVPESKEAIHLRREPLTWTVLADSLVLSGVRSFELPSESLPRIDVGRNHGWLGAGIGLLAGIGVNVIFINNAMQNGGFDGTCGPIFIMAAPAVLGTITGAIIGRSIMSWDTIYSSSP